MADPKRNSRKTHDPHSVVNNTYNEHAGAEKNISVGHHLRPLNAGVPATATTNAAAGVAVLPGIQLAVYNNAGAVGSITVRSATGTSLAPGAVDATTGEVGIPCQPNAWTYVSVWDKSFVITSASTLLVFQIADGTLVHSK